MAILHWIGFDQIEKADWDEEETKTKTKTKKGKNNKRRRRKKTKIRKKCCQGNGREGEGYLELDHN